jgi:sorbitol-specific phosphotransferase system component IIC
VLTNIIYFLVCIFYIFCLVCLLVFIYFLIDFIRKNKLNNIVDFRKYSKIIKKNKDIIYSAIIVGIPIFILPYFTDFFDDKGEFFFFMLYCLQFYFICLYLDMNRNKFLKNYFFILRFVGKYTSTSALDVEFVFKKPCYQVIHIL